MFARPFFPVLACAFSVLGCLAALLLGGCKTKLTKMVRELEPYEEQPPLVQPLYRTAPGDVLQIEYSRSPPGEIYQDEYRLAAGDRLSIVFESRPEFSRDVAIRPDGKFAYYRTGDIAARGMTVAELTAMLLERFADIPNASITVFVDEVNAVQDDFFDMLVASPNGPTREVALRMDGTVSLPFVGQIPLNNATIAEAERAIEQGYADQGVHIRVSLNVHSVGSNRYLVLGDVNKPGTFALTPGMTVVEAMATVGGELVSADMTRVVWITSGSDGQQTWRLLDIQGFLGGVNPGQNPQLRPGDTVFVPRSGAGDVNRFVDLYLRRNLPFNVSVGVGYRFATP